MENALQHHGIIGQKWGVRRYQNADGTLTAAGKKRQGKNTQKQAKQQKIKDYKNRDEMSDAELQKKINRLRMEKEYGQLTDEEVRKGQSFVKGVLKDAARRALVTMLSDAMINAGKVIVGKAMPESIRSSSPAPKVNPNFGKNDDNKILTDILKPKSPTLKYGYNS